MELKATTQVTEQPNQTVASATSPKQIINWKQNFFDKTKKDFDEYYTKYYPKLVWYISKMNIDKLDSEDIVNQAFMQSLEKIHQYNPIYQYSTWLFTIAKKMAYQYKKDMAKTIVVDMNTDSSDEDSNYDSVQSYLKLKMDTARDTYEETMEYHTKSHIKYAETMKEIMKLDVKYRTIIELSDIEGKTYNEICDILGDQLGKTPEQKLQTVKNRLHHGRLRLEKNLKEKFDLIEQQY